MIKDFNRFMYNQTQHRERKHFCMHCLKCFSSERVLADHREVCVSINGKQAIRMPEPGSILKYENRRKQLDTPLVIYADFEAITEKVSGCAQVGSKPYTDNTRNTPTVGTPMLVCCNNLIILMLLLLVQLDINFVLSCVYSKTYFSFKNSSYFFNSQIEIEYYITF